MTRRAHRGLPDFCSALLSFSLVVLPIAGAGACGGAVTEAGTGPITPTDTTKPVTPTVQRGSMTVEVSVHPDDAALASSIGLVRSGLTVRITRNVSSEAPRSAVTDGNGIAKFDSLLEGRYQISVDRPITASEATALAPENRDIGIFAAGTTVDYAPPTRTVGLQLVASRRGSLVVSEIVTWRGNQTDLAYPWATYVEVYNASDTTIYLDGMLLGVTPGALHIGESPNFPCETFNNAARTDSTSLWFQLVYAFPGQGREYPIRSGQAMVVAQDAMNHVQAGIDLSRAEFEQIGTDADIDNPFSADMRRVFGSTGALGRGSPASSGTATALLLPGAERQLTRDSVRATIGSMVQVMRAPRSQVLDVMAIDFPATSYAGSSTLPCRPFLSTVFDRDPTTLRNLEFPLGVARKSLGRTVSGIEILQRTHNSNRDFELRPPLRRSLNRP